jgi:hypothetical protein
MMNFRKAGYERHTRRRKSQVDLAHPTVPPPPLQILGIRLTIAGCGVQAAVTEKCGSGYQVDVGIAHQARGHSLPEVIVEETGTAGAGVIV